MSYSSGKVLRRLVSKCLSKSVQADALRILTPLHVGVVVKVRCEAVVHTVTQVLEGRNIPPDSSCMYPPAGFYTTFHP